MMPSQSDRLLHRKPAALREEYENKGTTRSDSRDRKRDVEQIKPDAPSSSEWSSKGALLSGKVRRAPSLPTRADLSATWS